MNVTELLAYLRDSDVGPRLEKERLVCNALAGKWALGYGYVRRCSMPGGVPEAD